MWLDWRRIALVLMILVLTATLSACQLLDRAGPTAVPPAVRNQPAQVPADAGQAGGDQSPRIRDPQDVPPTWTPPATARSETPIAPEVVITAEAGERQETYTVQPGDTLAEIAIRYNITLEALATANGIEDYDHIEAGQVLVIPR